MSAAAMSTSLPRQALERLGEKLAHLTDTTTLSKSRLAALDLDTIRSDFKNNKNAFHDHIPQLSRKLFGKTTFGRYSNMASKLMPDTTFEQATDAAFTQLGKLAQRWAHIDLSHDARFNQRKLDDSERHALAQAIANQNRSLATLGGISNLTGLAGILVDTLWLLTVSLRSIFQIAQIYDKPLTGKQGIAIAYEVLAKTDLKKLQEKQTLLAGLGIIETVAYEGFAGYRRHASDPHANDDEKTADEPQTLASQSQYDAQALSIQQVLGKVEEVATNLNVNLSNFNFGFLHKILPISAVGIGMTYNNIIINEVVQIAQNTFAPVPKLAMAADVKQASQHAQPEQPDDNEQV